MKQSSDSADMKIEVQHEPGGMTDTERMQLGVDLLQNFIASEEGNTDLPAASDWLEKQGFESEWLQHDDDLLLCLLWRFTPSPANPEDIDEHRLLDEFILEFSGHDAAIVSLFCMTESRSF